MPKLTMSARTRPFTRFAISAGALALFAGAATAADLPQILDRVPADAVAVVASPSLGQLDKNMGAAMTAMGGRFAVAELLAGIGMPNKVAMDKPAAIVLLPGDMNADLPPVVALLPVGDFQQFSAGLGGKEDAGITVINLAGESIFAKPVDGGYAALSPMKDLLSKTEFAAGQIGAHASNMGTAGGQVASNADAFLLLNAEKVRALSAAGQNPFGGMMQGAMTKMGLPMLGRGDMFSGAMGKDATGAVIGIRPGAEGLHLDAALNYRPGTPAANNLQKGGDSKSLMKALPADPFLLAFAVDLTPPGIRSLLGGMRGGGDQAGALDPSFFALVDDAKSQAGVIYPNPAGLMTGFLSRGIYFYGAEDSGKLADAFKTLIEKMNNQMFGSMQASSAYKPAGATVDGVSVDAWNLKLSTPAGQGGSPVSLMYGPVGGPNGHVVKGKNGIYTTTTPDVKLAAKALTASKGEATMADDKNIAQVAAMLPASRTAEAYIGVKAIIEQITPWLKMMGKPIDYKTPETLAPIGIGAVVDGGGFRIDAYAPIATLQAARAFANAATAPAATPAIDADGKAVQNPAPAPAPGAAPAPAPGPGPQPSPK